MLTFYNYLIFLLIAYQFRLFEKVLTIFNFDLQYVPTRSVFLPETILEIDDPENFLLAKVSSDTTMKYNINK